MPHGLAEDELETAYLEVGAQGATETVQLDAEEDREIVGYQMSLETVPTGTTAKAQGRAYIGSDPIVTQNTDQTDDLGGKFYASSYVQSDTTNGLAFVDMDGQFRGEHPGWDWNEDATLTFEVEEDSSNGVVRMNLEIYYREI